MNSSSRKLCVILNNSAYTHLLGKASVELKTLHDIDTANIQLGFEKLQFDCEIHKDKTGSEIVSTFLELSSRDELKAVSCLAVFVLSITDSDSIVGVDGVSIPFSHIKALFQTSCCPQLAGRPKLFFLQTSRGTDQGRGMVVQHDSNDLHSPWSFVPDDADVLVGYSTTLGCMSYGISQKGSLFITILMDVLEKHSRKLDILSCMQIVNNDMANMNLEFQGTISKQIACPMFTLRKQVFLGRDKEDHSSVNSKSEN